MKRPLLLAMVSFSPTFAHAYIGPDSGFGILGAVVGIIGVVLLAAF